MSDSLPTILNRSLILTATEETTKQLNEHTPIKYYNLITLSNYSKMSYRCISAAKTTKAALRTSVEAKEGQHMNTKAITHGFMFFIVHLQKLDIRIHFSKLAHLYSINKLQKQENMEHRFSKTLKNEERPWGEELCSHHNQGRRK